MSGAPKALLALAAVAFVIAVITTITGDVAGIPPEGYSRSSTNLALIAIAMHMFNGKSSD